MATGALNSALTGCFILALLGGLAPMAHAAVTEGQGKIVVRSATLEVVLDPARKGVVESLRDRKTGREMAAGPVDTDLFRLRLRPGDEANRLYSRRVEQVTWAPTPDGAGAVITFHDVEGRGIRVDCTVQGGEDEPDLTWRIAVHGPPGVVLEEINYPMVMLRTPVGEDDRLVAGLTKGGVFHRPSDWRQGTTIWARQPGQLAAQFGCYYDDAGGLYTATRDPRGYPKTFAFRRVKEGLEHGWLWHTTHDLAAPFEAPYDVAWRAFGGPGADWRDAADIYKAWALEQPWCARVFAERDDLPEWTRQGPAMVRFNREWLADPERIEAWLRDYWQVHFPDAPLIVAFWGWEKVASWISPDYFPPFPSEEGLARIVRAVKAVGGHAFFWPSGYHWNETYGKRPDGTFEWDDRERFGEVGLPHATLLRGGKLWGWDAPWLQGGTNRSLCRGDEWTRQWLNDIAVELVKRGGDMVQVDQVVGGLPPAGGACYSTEHGHAPGQGLWDTEAFFDQLDSMLRECRRVDPDTVLGIEEPQEFHIQQVGIQDYRDSQQAYGNPKQDERASVFGYLYHEFLPCFQSNPWRGDRMTMAYCLVTGQVPHLIPHWPLEPSTALRNGSFDEWDGDVPAGWQHVTGYQGQSFDGRPHREGDAAHSGDASLRIECTAEGDIGQISQNVPIGANALQPGRRYRFGLWHRGARVTEGNPIVLGAFDPNWQAKGTWAIPLSPSDDWRHGVVQFTMPSGAVRLRIMLQVIGPANVWLDDVTLEEEADDGTWRDAMQTGLPPEHDLAVRWVELFHGEGRPFLQHGRMVHPPKLDAAETPGPWGRPVPAVLHNAFRASDGREAVIAVNVTGEPQQCTLHWQGAARDLQFAPWEAKLITQ